MKKTLKEYESPLYLFIKSLLLRPEIDFQKGYTSQQFQEEKAQLPINAQFLCFQIQGKVRKVLLREHIRGQIMLLVFQSRSNRESSEIREIYSKLNLDL